MTKKKILLTGLIMLTSVVLYSQNATIKVVVNNAPPFRIIQDNEISGIYCDIINEIAEDMDLKIEYKEVPFARALEMMKEGHADMMLGPNKKSDREKYMVYLTRAPLPKVNKALFTKKGLLKVTEKTDLKELTIAQLRGSNYLVESDCAKIFEVTENISGLKMLNANRVDAMILPEFLGDYLIKQNDFELLKQPFFISGSSSFFTISKKSSLITKLTEIEDAMLELNNKGIITEIIDRYK